MRAEREVRRILEVALEVARANAVTIGEAVHIIHREVETHETIARLRAENARLKGRIVLASDALVEEDLDAAYQQLYGAADPDYTTPGNPFRKWREHADDLLDSDVPPDPECQEAQNER